MPRSRHGSKAGLPRGPALLLPFAAVGIGLWWAESAWLAVGLYDAGMLAALAGARVSPRRPPGGGGLGPAGWAAAAAAVLSGPALAAAWPWLDPAGELPSRLAAAGLGGAGLAVFLAWFATGNVILEELYWRGWLGRGAREAAWADTAFGGYHALVLAWFVPWGWALAAAVVLAACGAWWRRLGPSWVPAGVAHAAGAASAAVVLALRAA